jgi:osmotically inducible protein OsmC
MAVRSAMATWDGDVENGRGDMKPEHGPDMPFSRMTRFDGVAGPNPEEVIGAALAGCFSMALSARLARAGMSPKHIRTTASVHFDAMDGDFEIRQIDLSTEAYASGGDEDTLRMIAEDTKDTCPVGKLLGTMITLKTKLVHDP